MVRRRLLVAAVMLAALLAVGLGTVLLAPAMRNQWTYGTVSTDGIPPRIHFCDRDYLPAPITAAKSRREVDDDPLAGIGTTPSGMPVLANVLSPASRASLHTNVCTMVVWVEMGPNQYLAYGLSGGP